MKILVMVLMILMKKEMNMRKFLVGLCAVLMMAAGVYAGEVTYAENLANDSGLGYSKNFQVATQNSGSMCFQVVYSSAPLGATATATDGVKSTGTITVTTNSGVTGAVLTLQGMTFTEGIDYSAGVVSSNTASNLYAVLASTWGAQATGYITVLTTYSLTGSSFTLNGVVLKEGRDWFVADTATGTAKSIYQAMYMTLYGTYYASLSTNQVNLVSCIYGAAGNYTFSTFTSSITVSSMSGGRHVPLSGLAFSRGSTSSVIYATATAAGINGSYVLASSTPTALTVAGMTGGVNSAINYYRDTVSVASHGYHTGEGVRYNVTVGTAAYGLTNATTYYVIYNDANSFKLATSKVNAGAGTSIDMSENTTSGSGTFTLTPCPWSGTFGLKWQCSNDGVNRYDVDATSITYSGGAGGNYVWTFTTIYKYLYLVAEAPVQGVLNLAVPGYGKN